MTQKFYFKDAATEESAKTRGFELLEELTKILHVSYETPSEKIIEMVRRCLKDDDPSYSTAWEEVGEIIGIELGIEYGEVWEDPDESMKEELNTLFRDYLKLKELVVKTFGSIENFEKNREQIATILQEQTNNA
jgi:hypothetical protein